MILKKHSDGAFYGAIGILLVFAGTAIMKVKEFHSERFDMDLYGTTAIALGAAMGILGVYFIIWSIKKLVKK